MKVEKKNQQSVNLKNYLWKKNNQESAKFIQKKAVKKYLNKPGIREKANVKSKELGRKKVESLHNTYITHLIKKEYGVDVALISKISQEAIEAKKLIIKLK